MTAAAEWLLVNAYLIRTQIAETRRHLPRDYPNLVPGLRARPTCPEVYDLAAGLVKGTDHSLNEGNITECLRQYQTTAPLTIAELWLFPLLLRLALFESLAGLAASVCRAQQLREVAYLWANRLAVSMRRGRQRVRHDAGAPRDRAVRAAAVLRDLPGRNGFRMKESALALKYSNGSKIALRCRSPTCCAQRAPGGGIGTHLHRQRLWQSPRHLQNRFLTEVFEAVSLVDAELRKDPAGVYTRSDFATRDQCRRSIERIALESGGRRVGRGPARDYARGPCRRRADHSRALLSPGGWPHGAGGVVRRSRAASHPPDSCAAGSRSHAGAVSYGRRRVSRLRFLALALVLAWDGGVHQPAMLAVLGAMALFPLGELAIQIVNALVISLLPPDLLPKLDFEKGFRRSTPRLWSCR